MLKKYLPILLLLVIIVPTFMRLIRPGYFPMHDDMQAMRLLQMDKCIKDGQVPCRWVPDMGFGYGYPQFNYYSPLPYYVMEIFHLLGFSILGSVKLGLLLSIVLSAVGMYVLGTQLWGRTGGLISAILYAYSPYRAMDLWVRGAMGELWAFAFLPFIFWSIKRVVDGERFGMIWLAVSTAALLTSHNITSLIFLPIAALWTIYLIFQKYGSPTSWDTSAFRPIFFGFLWGFALSAFFILPAWFERNLVQIESLVGGYFDYTQHFVSVGQLLFSTYWNFGSSQFGRFDEAFLGVGISQWTIPVVSILILFMFKKYSHLKTLLFLVSLGFVALFMSHPKSMFIWRAASLLRFLQFPWRFLVLATFLFSISAGAIGLRMKSKNINLKLILLIGVVAVLMSASYFRPVKWLDIDDAYKFSGDEWQRQQTISIKDYLPKTVQRAPDFPAPKDPLLESGEVFFEGVAKTSNKYSVNVFVGTDSVNVKLPLYFFPGWKVEVNGAEATINSNNELGLIEIHLLRGDHKVIASFSNTPIRTASNVISLLGILLIPVYIFKMRN